MKKHFSCPFVWHSFTLGKPHVEFTIDKATYDLKGAFCLFSENLDLSDRSPV